MWPTVLCGCSQPASQPPSQGQLGACFNYMNYQSSKLHPRPSSNWPPPQCPSLPAADIYAYILGQNLGSEYACHLSILSGQLSLLERASPSPATETLRPCGNPGRLHMLAYPRVLSSCRLYYVRANPVMAFAAPACNLSLSNLMPPNKLLHLS